MSLIVDILPDRIDNYIFMIRCQESGFVGVVDPCSAAPVVDYLQRLDLGLDAIFITHHHQDHVGGNLELKGHYGAKVYASASDNHRIPGVDVTLVEGEIISFGSQVINVIETSGHTLGAICFFFETAEVLFCGDTLFSLGCGRLFEGRPDQMLESLEKISRLPPRTQVFCAHEYTEKNASFALRVEPENQDLKIRYSQVLAMRASGKTSLPTTIALERASNPFLRLSQPSIRKHLNLQDAADVEVLAELRRQRDIF